MADIDWVGFGSIATAVGVLFAAVGVLFAAVQLWLSRRQERTQFEDGLVQQYRDLLNRIPVAALLGEPLNEETQQAHLGDFYHYFDLCNEQVFLRQQNRISEPTWEMWRDGIRTNMSRPAFAAAWRDVIAKSKCDFAELRRLESTKYRGDPKNPLQNFDRGSEVRELRRAA